MELFPDRARTDPLSVLEPLARLLAGEDDLDRVLGPALRMVSEATGMRWVALWMVDRERSQIAILAAPGLTQAESARGRWGLGEGCIGRVASTGDPALVANLDAIPDFVDRTGARDPAVDRALVCVPVFSRREVVAALSAYRGPSTRERLEDDAALLTVVASMLTPTIEHHRETQRDASEATGRVPRPPNMIGNARSMLEVYDLVDKVADSGTTVLLLGESGTGKELVASALHERSPRSRRAFVKVNCAALPETVIESELFGHERGAFTGAHQQRKGRFEQADRGTLFLDEIGDLSPQTQIKLLRVLQEREFERVGGNTSVEVDVRIIAATSRNLDELIETGDFRRDLYYRLNVFPIHLPPLRERRADILLLADHFVEVFNRVHGRQVRRIATSAIDMLMSYHWPGNVRELENCMERALLLTRDDTIHGHHLPPTLQLPGRADPYEGDGLRARLAEVERGLILDALKATRGNMAQAARDLRITERIMGLRVERYGIDPARFKAG